VKEAVALIPDPLQKKCRRVPSTYIEVDIDYTFPRQINSILILDDSSREVCPLELSPSPLQEFLTK
jgi:hypothetical protein